MRPLRYSINITLDGCCAHDGPIVPDAEQHMFWADQIAAAGALLYGRVTYGMMEAGWRKVAETGIAPEGMPEWMVPFAHAIDKARKYVVSDTLESVDWNTELIRGDELRQRVEELRQQPGDRISLGGVKLPLALAEMGLIDEYEFLVHPVVAGRGPTLLAGLTRHVDLKLVDRREFGSGAMLLLYEAKR